MAIQLEIFVESDCANCDTAFDIAELVRSEVPEVDVSIVNLSTPGVRRPREIFAVPTYLLNGETRSLGNPDGPQLVAELKAMVKD